MSTCKLKFEHFKEAYQNGPLLDENWTCRKCHQLVADHEMINDFSPNVYLDLETLLSQSTGPVNANVVARMRRRFGTEVLMAIYEKKPLLAREIYIRTEALPQTQTELGLSANGYTMNGPWHAGIDTILICYKETRTYLLKLLQEKEYTRAKVLDDILGTGDSRDGHPNLISFELQTTQSSKFFMIMPFYITTLESIPTLTDIISGQRVENQISSAIQFLHDKGFVHMDVKPSNICLNDAGNAILIDLGSMVRRSCYSESTVVYVPPDYQKRSNHNRNSNRYHAEDELDWWMLAMSLAEKIYNIDIGGSANSPTREVLRDLLLENFSELCSRLTIN